MSRKSYASLLVLPSLFARSTRNFESQMIYISAHCLAYLLAYDLSLGHR